MANAGLHSYGQTLVMANAGLHSYGQTLVMANAGLHSYGQTLVMANASQRKVRANASYGANTSDGLTPVMDQH